MKLQLVALMLVCIGCSFASDNNSILRARVESCGGWRLNGLPEVKKFIFEDIPLYPQAEFKRVPGASPELFYLNSLGEVVEKVDLSKKSRQECNQLLLDKNFFKKNRPEDPVPEHILATLPAAEHPEEL